MIAYEDLTMVKNAFDTIRTVLALFKDLKDALPNSDEKQAIEMSIAASENQILVAEAQVAQSLGYALCRCAFPPTPMLKVGYRHKHGSMDSIDVHECPKCHQCDADPYLFTRKIEIGN